MKTLPMTQRDMNDSIWRWSNDNWQNKDYQNVKVAMAFKVLINMI